MSGAADHDEIPDPAPRATQKKLASYPNLDRHAITVSGLSSGGFFAHQFHVAYSTLVTGAGIIAGGPYGCVENIPNPYWPWLPLDRFSAAVVACTHYLGNRFYGLRPSIPKVEASVDLIRTARRERAIDDPANLADDRVWLFLGRNDDVVPNAVVRVVKDLYQSLGVPESNVQLEEGRASHGMPVDTFPQESRFPRRGCGEHKPPFIIDCGFDAAERLLRHLYADDFAAAPKDAHDHGTLITFDQREFFDPGEARTSMSAVAYAYVPAQCAGARCRLHVAFHGCRQNVDSPDRERVHDDFIRDGGYNRWAAANGIVVLYPQLTESALNPNRCWDFWGYSSSEYYGRNGPQMRAVKAMVDRLLGTRN
jgi:poly(3-hydroxybutyrate) depolymerase